MVGVEDWRRLNGTCTVVVDSQGWDVIELGHISFNQRRKGT